MPKPARSRDSERYRSESNETKGRWLSLSYEKSYEGSRRKDVQPVLYITKYIKCAGEGKQALKITNALAKQCAAMCALGIKEIVLNKVSGVPTAMLRGDIARTFELPNGKLAKAKYKGRGSWVINIVG